MGSSKQNASLKLEINFNNKGLIMAMSTDACWVGHFCVESDFFVSNEC